MLGAAVLGAAAFVVLGFAITVGVAFAVAVVTGVSRSLLEVSGQTLLQRVTSTAILARVFSFKEGLAMAAWGVGSVMVPIVIGIAGLKAALIFTGAIVPVVVFVRLRPLLAVDVAAVVPVVTIALLRSVGIFRALPVAALEGVAHGAIDVAVPAGETVIRQGDVGDRYFAIADGSVEVVRDGARVSTLARGNGFGEIALLHDVPRTATVRAMTDSRLIVIERDAFLIALTGHAPTRVRAEKVAEERRSAASPSLSNR